MLRSLADVDQGMTVYDVRQGWRGLVDGQFQQLSARDVGGIIQVGGTFLGSARSTEFREESGRSKALRNLAHCGIDGVVHASTIDNDLLGTDISIGCATVINVRLRRLTTCARPVPRTIGHFWSKPWGGTGYLAMMAGVAGGGEVISTPEFEVSASEIAQRLRAAYERGKTHAIVVIAEGVNENAAKILAYFDAEKQTTGFELRASTLGRVVRGAPPQRLRSPYG